MSLVGIEMLGAEQLAARIRADVAELASRAPLWLETAGDILRESIKAEIIALDLVESGDLHNSGRIFANTGRSINVSFGFGTEGEKHGRGYAWALEVGAGPHDIPGKPLLYFWWENAGVEFVGPVVHHPGNIAYHYARGGLNASMTPIVFMFLDELHDIFEV